MISSATDGSTMSIFLSSSVTGSIAIAAAEEPVQTAFQRGRPHEPRPARFGEIRLMTNLRPSISLAPPGGVFEPEPMAGLGCLA